MSSKSLSQLETEISACNTVPACPQVDLSSFPPDIRKRVSLTVSCNDCNDIPKVPNAGKIVDADPAYQIMHNGVKVVYGGYHGDWMAEIIRILRGHHEPQEEKVFHDVLKTMPDHAVMIELGSFWSYYSMWFNRKVADAVNYMVEPISAKMKIGIENFKLNKMQGHFLNAFVGANSLSDASFVDWDGKTYHLPQISIDQFIKDNRIPFVHLLHSDIQGAEYDMLHGCVDSIAAGKIGYIFISTHGSCHEKCLLFLRAHNFHIISAHTIAESFSADGLIVASSPVIQRNVTVHISKKQGSNTNNSQNLKTHQAEPAKPSSTAVSEAARSNPLFRKDGNTWVAARSLTDQYSQDPQHPFLVSFPRTGSHWLRMLMELYFQKPALTRIFYCQAATEFTCCHTHDEDLKTLRKQVIYLWRNPVDTIYSQMSYYNEDLNDSSRIRYWSSLYARHLAKWLWEETFSERKIVLSYERMKENLGNEFEKLCDFLKVPFDPQRLEQAASQVSKEKLKDKNISDKQVVKISPEYESQRKNFKDAYGEYIYQVMLNEKQDLRLFLSDRNRDQHKLAEIEFVKNNLNPVLVQSQVPQARKFKIVGLVAARNEENIIAQCIRMLSKFTDAIVFLDDCSTDNTLRIVQSLGAECKVERVLTKDQWVRDEPGDHNRLLEAGRAIGGTHFILLDADETLTSNFLIDDKLRKLITSMQIGDQLLLNWICLWRSTNQYRHDKSVWTNNYKPFVFCDDGRCSYSSEFIHTPRVPKNLKGRIHKMEGYEYGVLHFQFVYWPNLLLKQAWYRCLERVRAPQKPAARINERYAPSKDETDLHLEPAHPDWFQYYKDFDPSVYELPDKWRLDQIQNWFDEYGTEYFKELDIWDAVGRAKRLPSPAECRTILVSAIVSTYNSEAFIRGCLQDLVEQTLYQKGQLEIVVVNSGSMQNEEAIVKEFQNRYSNIQYIRTPDRETIYAAWNRAVRIAKGKYITSANTDDRHAPEMLERLATMLEADTKVALIYSHFYVTEIPNQIWRNKTPSRLSDWHPEYSREALLKACFTGPQPMWRRSLHDEYGWFDESFKVAGDYEFFMRCSQTHDFKLNKEPLGLYYYNPQSLERSAGTRNAEDAWVKTYYTSNWGRIVRKPFDPLTEQSKKRDPTGTHTNPQEALSLFQRAHEEFQAGRLPEAENLIRQYHSKMDYGQLPVYCSAGRPKKPLFSVIIVTYNRAEDVAHCIRSLRAQPSALYELILIDNGDQKATEAAHLADVYVDCPINFYPAEGRNIGAALARGPILVFVDDDALVGPNYLDSIRKAFETYEILGLRGRILPKDKSGLGSVSSIYNLGNEPLVSISNIEGNNAFRRDAYLAVGGMDPLLFGHEGGEFHWRLIQRFNDVSAVIYNPETVIYHDYGDAQKSETKQARYKHNNEYILHKHGLTLQAMIKQIEGQRLRLKNIKSSPVRPMGTAAPQASAAVPERRKLFQKAAAAEAQPVEAAEPIAPGAPKVSVIMACHNAEAFLAETMDSLLAQTLTEWELLALDDGSTDNTAAMLRSYAEKDRRIRLWTFDDCKGPYVRRNFAIAHAAADFISIQDSDDIMTPCKLEVLHNTIQIDPRLAIVGSFFRRFLEIFRGEDFGDRMVKASSHLEIMEAFPKTWHVCWHGSAIIRKSLFESIGLYDEQPYGSDTFWLSKAGLYGFITKQVLFVNIPQYLTYKREHSGSQTGKISPVDPRSRRHKLESYYLYKLSKILEKAKADPALNVEAELRACTCTDFIPRFASQFEQWESQPVDDVMCRQLTDKALQQFAAEQYVSCLITLNGLDQMTGGKSRNWRNLNFTRGLSAYAAGEDAMACEYLREEIRVSAHRDAAALLKRLEAGSVSPLAWRRRKKIRDYITAASAQKRLQGTSAPPSLSGLAGNPQPQCALAEQFLNSQQAQQTARVEAATASYK
ncbi:MAG: glycosyltransferase [Planctomycetaceae bacterium]|nr:glycosyltransferase [Planctomycetaceae bacterium]